MAEYIKLGIVGKAHGLRGHFFISNRDGPIPMEYKELLIGVSIEKALKTIIIESKFQANRPLLLCSMASNREQASLLTGKGIWIEKAKVKNILKNEHIWDDFIGKEIIDIDNISIGKVIRVYNTGASDIFVVQNNTFYLDIPFISDYFDYKIDKHINLLVSREIFKEFWYTKRKS